MMEFVFQCILYPCLFQLVQSAGSNYDPRRWIISYKKPASQSTTNGEHYASFSTDGNFKNIFHGPGENYSQTLQETAPTFQIDLGESIAAPILHISTPKYDGFSTTEHNWLEVRFGNNPAADSTENQLCFHGTMNLWLRKSCGAKKGRYVNLIRKVPGEKSALKLTEVAVYKRPIENLAYRKSTARSTAWSDSFESSKAVDMIYQTIYSADGSALNWIRVNLDDIYLVHEVLIFARATCCQSGSQLENFELRIGESLAQNGNANQLCAKDIVSPGEARSFYCDMFGRYVNIYRQERYLYVAEIIVNPETTDNVAALASARATVTDLISGAYNVLKIVDQLLHSCYAAKMKEESKQLWINLGADYNVAMIHIINNADHVDQLKDFQIAVGMSNVFTDSTLCLPGLQSMDGIFAKLFFCEPDRILGNHVFIHQERTDLQMGICEVGVFEETKPKIVDRDIKRQVWSKLGDEITFDCIVKGYPAPVITKWVKDNVILKTGSSRIQLVNLKSNDTGVYECWANNTNGFDARVYQLKVTNELRMCVKWIEAKFVTDRPSAGIDTELNGKKWYKFYDAQKHTELQLREAIPSKQVPPCTVWMKDGHPSSQDGVVSRTLCVKNTTHDCSEKLDIYVRRCSHYYVYNFRDLRDVSGRLTLCMKSAENLLRGMQPVMASASRKHVLSGRTFHTEEDLGESHECLMLCQLDKKCKSFNFSRKLKICELNSGTKKEFPKNFVPNLDYDYHQLKHGVVRREL